MVASAFRPEVEIRPFRASGHNYRNSSFIVDVAMGQVPRSTERISSLTYIHRACAETVISSRHHSVPLQCRSDTLSQ